MSHLPIQVHRPLLTVENVNFSYPNQVKVITGFSDTFFGGKVTALTGPSGCGKSTLLYLLGLMHRQSSGEIFIDGRPTSSMSDSERAMYRANKFGFVFQDAVLDPSRSVLENVMETSLYRNESRSRSRLKAYELMEEFGVASRASHRPGQISGGQAQRIALCRALMADPAFIIADEPTGNLDPNTRNVVLDAFRSRADAGSCVIIATHDPDVVSRCDRQVFIGERLFENPRFRYEIEPS